MQDIEVSVILPSISVDSWLCEAVQSVLAQTGVEFEVVVVLDGVKVNSLPDWLRHPRVKVVRLQGRSGLARALNEGIQRAEAPLIARLDADDRALPGRLAAQVTYLNTHREVGLVGTHAYKIDSQGKRVGSLGVTRGNDVRKSLLVRNCVIHPSVMFRRSSYVAAGGYDASLPQMEDYDLWLRLATVAPVAVLPEPLIEYRVHTGQMSNGAKPHGHHIRTVLRNRFLLGRHLGVHWAEVFVYQLAWTAGQYVRYVKTSHKRWSFWPVQASRL